MTDREAVRLLNGINRRHTLLTTAPILTDEQVHTWSIERENGLLALARAGYALRFVKDPRPHYQLLEPAENEVSQ
jgi:hypothetical protein